MSNKANTPHRGWHGPLLLSALALALAITPSWGGAQDKLNGKDVFRFDTFGDESFWADTLRMHEAIAQAVDPTTALSVGLKVDADALPPGILKTADLKSPATTIALLKLNAVVGLKGTVASKDGKDTLTRWASPARCVTPPLTTP